MNRSSMSAFALAIAMQLSGCGSAPANPPVVPPDEPQSATMAAGGVIVTRLHAPKGAWKLAGVEVENARIVSRDGDAPLVLQLERSKPKLGQTTVEGADEPIRLEVTWKDERNGAREIAVFTIETPPKAAEGASLPVSVTW